MSSMNLLWQKMYHTGYTRTCLARKMGIARRTLSDKMRRGAAVPQLLDAVLTTVTGYLDTHGSQKQDIPAPEDKHSVAHGTWIYLCGEVRL